MPALRAQQAGDQRDVQAMPARTKGCGRMAQSTDSISIQLAADIAEKIVNKLIEQHYLVPHGCVWLDDALYEVERARYLPGAAFLMRAHEAGQSSASARWVAAGIQSGTTREAWRGVRVCGSSGMPFGSAAS